MCVCYGCEVCAFNKTEIRLLQHVVKSCFSKIFHTRSDDIIAVCMENGDVRLLTCMWPMSSQDVGVIFC